MAYNYDRRTAVRRAPAIGALERSVKSLAKRLERMGLETEVDAFRAGRGATDLDTSYVELEVEVTFTDEDGNEDDATSFVKFYAGGYDGERAHEFGGVESVREMTSKALDFILKNLKAQGWKPPA